METIYLTSMKKEFFDYRNTHIGFIFQDYHLIDELTVYENIVFILLLGILSLFIPMLKIRRIKPVKIIKTKE